MSKNQKEYEIPYSFEDFLCIGFALLGVVTLIIISIVYLKSLFLLVI